ncbi:hypothetical protein D3C71_1804810 [compost metagenome]
MALLMVQTANILFQLLSHMVEGSRQLANLVTCDQRQPCSVFTTSNVVCSLDDTLHRLSDLGKQEQREECRQRKSDHARIHK